MIANNKTTNKQQLAKIRNNKHSGYVNYQCTKNVTAQPIFSSKNIASFFKIVLDGGAVTEVWTYDVKMRHASRRAP